MPVGWCSIMAVGWHLGWSRNGDTMTSTLPAEKNTLAITNASGHFEVSWDPSSPTEVAAARKAFEQAQKDKMLIYSTDRRGNKGEKMAKFDPAAEKIVCTRQYQGG